VRKEIHKKRRKKQKKKAKDAFKRLHRTGQTIHEGKNRKRRIRQLERKKSERCKVYYQRMQVEKGWKEN